MPRYEKKYLSSPIQAVEAVPEAVQPPVREYILHLTPDAARALRDLTYGGSWPLSIQGGAGRTPGELLNAIHTNLDAALKAHS